MRASRSDSPSTRIDLQALYTQVVSGKSEAAPKNSPRLTGAEQLALEDVTQGRALSPVALEAFRYPSCLLALQPRRMALVR